MSCGCLNAVDTSPCEPFASQELVLQVLEAMRTCCHANVDLGTPPAQLLTLGFGGVAPTCCDRLTVSDTNKYWESFDNGVTWLQIHHSLPSAKLYLGGNPVLPDSTNEQIVYWSLVEYDLYGNMRDGANQERLIAPVDGIYHIYGQVNHTTTTKVAIAGIRKVGGDTLISGTNEHYHAGTGAITNVNLSLSVELSAQEYVWMYIGNVASNGSPISYALNSNAFFGMDLLKRT